MTTSHSLLQVSSVPDPFLHLIATKQVLALSNKLISPQLNILVEEIATEHLLAILIVQEVAHDKEGTKGSLRHECQVLVMEHDIVVVEEHESCDATEHHVLLVVWVVDIQVGHVIVPFGIVWVKEEGIEWELWSNTFGHIEQVKHLFNGLVALLAHTSAQLGK